MKLSVNTQILEKYNLSLGEFLALLTNYYCKGYTAAYDALLAKGLAETSLFHTNTLVLSDNTKNLIAKILIESNDKITNSNIDFEALASKLQELYPNGIKPNTTHAWRGTIEDITQKLRVLIAKYNFTFTEEEAISAVKEYTSSFVPPYKYMHTLKNFILYTTKHYEIESQFMSIIENHRSTKENE